jgi:hypothetical protein
MTTNRQDQDPAAQPRQGADATVEAVEASDLEAAPEGQRDPQGASYHNSALTGSGTIMPDGTYGAPLPDPLLVKRQEDPGVTSDTREPDAGTEEKPSTPKRTRKA